MTVFLPLEEETHIPQTPPFLAEPADRKAGLAKVVQAVLKAKRIVVICGAWHPHGAVPPALNPQIAVRPGAGISVQAGIPDFRSAAGLFKTLKRDHPREALGSGKDLFDASVFNSEHTTSLFCQMMARLSDMSQNAEPTAFHQLLRALDDRGRLLRVYTQNIDAIEQKCGSARGQRVATRPPDSLLIGSSKGKGRGGADFILVVGTSLRIPGTKRMVREFAKAVRSRCAGSSIREEASGSGSTTPNHSSRHSPSIDEDPPPAPMKAVYLNLDFPVGTREWEGVFDAWVQGDAQTFAEMLRDEIRKEMKAKELASERKRRREEEIAAASEPSDVEMARSKPIYPPPSTQASLKKRGATRAARNGANPARGEDEDGQKKAEAPPEMPPPPLPITPSPSSSRRSTTKFMELPVSPLDASPLLQRQWKTPSLGCTAGPSRRYQYERAQWSPYRSTGTYRPLNILTLPLQPTLEDLERMEWYPVEVGRYKYGGAG
ncbi:hypothetical protein D9611_015135 [Ephemerocybe angulata]|uniref:Deacetylase sirtuin-type domain-containing protein n=1 Tax=Ephemerocybe angulata TaxID=980116 RepID=A0A8H5F994_9AGAR|nr:hypothetical protein D9611_015135 [Tulosesus angulatus]